MKLDAESWDGLIWKMLAGRLEEDPFTSQQKADGAAVLLKWTSDKGFPLTPSADDQVQTTRI